MWTNKDTLDVINDFINRNNIIIKSRRSGSSNAANIALEKWSKIHKSYTRRYDRIETIKKLFNI
jgi:hypothetical protein